MSRLTEQARNAALARARVDAHIRALVDSWPPFTAEQMDRLSALLQPGLEAAHDAVTAEGAPKATRTANSRQSGAQRVLEGDAS